MTEINLSQFKPIPGFDCVAMKQAIQATIFEETKNMTLAEIREQERQTSERFWALAGHRRTELTTEAQARGVT